MHAKPPTAPAPSNDTAPGDCPDDTRRGVPGDYAGDDPYLCNARTRSGRPCRALKLRGGRCKWHGGLSTGPTTPEGKAKCADNLRRWQQAQRAACAHTADRDADADATDAAKGGIPSCAAT